MTAGTDTDVARFKDRRCLALQVLERWVFGERRGEAEALFLQLDDGHWFTIQPDKDSANWTVTRNKNDPTQQPLGAGDNHYRLRNAGVDYGLVGLRIENVYQKPLGERTELCLEFSNATDLTVHYDRVTGGSSLYFIND